MGQEYSEDNATRISLLGESEHIIKTRLLDTVGDGTGTKNAAAVANEYMITPGSTEIYTIDEIRIVVAGSKFEPQADLFGDLAALATGCLLQVRRLNDGIVINDLLDGIPIKDNAALSIYGDIFIHPSTTMAALSGSLVSVAIKYNKPIRLDGSRYESLVFKTQDDLSALDKIYVAVHVTEYTNTR